MADQAKEILGGLNIQEAAEKLVAECIHLQHYLYHKCIWAWTECPLCFKGMTSTDDYAHYAHYPGCFIGKVLGKHTIPHDQYDAIPEEELTLGHR